MEDPALLSLAVQLVRAASELISRVRTSGFAVTTKTDETPVTEADHAAERLIVAGLRAGTPDIPVVAEEEVAGGRYTAPGPVFWLVDPLDGTREFAQGRAEFACQIGLVREQRAVLGVVGLPAFGEIFAGIVGGGAWKSDANGQRPIQARQPPSDGLTVMASRHYQHDPQLAAFLSNTKVASVHNLGSSVKFCRLAEGVADLYPRLGTTMEWDTAAPQAVLEAAGGSVRLLDGGPLLYGKPGWKNPHFLCRGL
jgi:3'(2'), 5'-bisphosphate nucleotidase